MNLRHFSIALLISALPSFASANPAVSLNEGDFIAAERISRDGETVVSVKLSKSGKAKLRKIKEHSAVQEIRVEVGGVSSDFKMREPIAGDEMEMGPYSPEDAQKVISEIKKK